ncbi:hypothetical protein DY000_02038114 [Brassica cretica]|uniref:Zinc finger GRF-type domain-containing protein n=1 Tax=Brassica cretica TaxID=69181 RepID=A0ABQ7BKY9_BRACR|nr:hypothetical protein DY000_02038114 [Brassica cretica]
MFCSTTASSDQKMTHDTAITGRAPYLLLCSDLFFGLCQPFNVAYHQQFMVHESSFAGTDDESKTYLQILHQPPSSEMDEEQRDMKAYKPYYQRVDFVSNSLQGIPQLCPCGSITKEIIDEKDTYDYLPGKRYFICKDFKNDSLHYRQPWVMGVQEEVERLKQKVLRHENLVWVKNERSEVNERANPAQKPLAGELNRHAGQLAGELNRRVVELARRAQPSRRSARRRAEPSHDCVRRRVRPSRESARPASST